MNPLAGGKQDNNSKTVALIGGMLPELPVCEQTLATSSAAQQQNFAVE
jgi:hypothetical protein